MPVSIQAPEQVYLIVTSLFKRRLCRLEWPAVELPLSSVGHAEQRRVMAPRQAQRYGAAAVKVINQQDDEAMKVGDVVTTGSSRYPKHIVEP